MNLQPESILEDAKDAIAFPDRASSRLVERALAEQWDLELDLPWPDIQLSDLHRGIRAAMLAVYSQIHFGEVQALRLAKRALDCTGESWAREFCRMQVVDEVRHVAFFSRVLGQLGGHRPIGPEMASFGAMLDDCQSPAEIALGVQVILESFAHTVFLEGARLGRAAADGAIRFPHTAVASRFLTVLAEYVGKDESRHVAFGVHYLRGHLAQLPARELRQLEAKADGWIAALVRATDEVAVDAAALGIPGPLLKRKVAAVHQRHLRSVGLEDLASSLLSAEDSRG